MMLFTYPKAYALLRKWSLPSVSPIGFRIERIPSLVLRPPSTTSADRSFLEDKLHPAFGCVVSLGHSVEQLNISASRQTPSR